MSGSGPSTTQALALDSTAATRFESTIVTRTENNVSSVIPEIVHDCILAGC